MDQPNHNENVGHFPAGVYVVGVQLGEYLRAFTVSALMQASTEPPMLCVALPKGSDCNDAIRKTGVFSLSALGPGDEALAGRLGEEEAAVDAAEDREPLDSLFETESCGGPVLVGCRAWAQCVLMEIYEPPGDHDLFLGQVTGSGVAADASERAPLLKNA